MTARRDFIGDRGAHAQADGFSCGHWTADVWGDAVAPHGHDDPHLMLVTAGAYETAADGDPSGPVLVYNPPGVWHTDRFVGGAGSFFALTVSPARFEALQDLGLPGAPTRLSAQRLRGLLVRLMRAACAGAAVFEMDRTALCLELMAAVAGDDDTARRSPPPWLDQACQMLRARQPVGIDAVSAALGVHPAHLARTFRRFLRCTPGEYRLAGQLEAAADALALTRAPISEVALDSGFADQSHFTRRFRAAYGAPPAEYRRRLAA